MKTYNDRHLFPERYRMLYIPTNGPRSNPEHAAIRRNSSPSFGNITRCGFNVSNIHCECSNYDLFDPLQIAVMSMGHIILNDMP